MVLYNQGTRSGGRYSLGSWVRGGGGGGGGGGDRTPYDTGSICHNNIPIAESLKKWKVSGGSDDAGYGSEAKPQHTAPRTGGYRY